MIDIEALSSSFNYPCMKNNKRVVAVEKSLNKDRQVKNKTGVHMLEGALIGVTLAAAAGIFARSRTGKKVLANMRDKSAEFYNYIAPQIKKIKTMSKAEYSAFIDSAVERFGKLKKLSATEARELSNAAKASLADLKDNLAPSPRKTKRRAS